LEVCELEAVHIHPDLPAASATWHSPQYLGHWNQKKIVSKSAFVIFHKNGQCTYGKKYTQAKSDKAFVRVQSTTRIIKRSEMIEICISVFAKFL